MDPWTQLSQKGQLGPTLLPQRSAWTCLSPAQNSFPVILWVFLSLLWAAYVNSSEKGSPIAGSTLSMCGASRIILQPCIHFFSLSKSL
jgi:hypothetical protein